MKKRVSKAISVLAAATVLMSQASVSVSAKAVGVATHRHMGYATETLLEKVNEAEASWIRQDYSWQGIDNNGKLQVPDYLKDYTEKAKAEGINVLAILGFGNPDMANATSMTMPTKSNEKYFDAWEDYVRFTVSELRGSVDAYEIWNEPDTLRFNDKAATPAEYGELVIATYEIIKEVDPSAKVLAGAFLGGNAGVTAYEKYDDGREYIYQFMKSMNAYKNQRGTYPFDALSVHIYPQMKDGEVEYEVDGSFGWFMTPLDETYYDGDVWVTEWGFYTSSDDRALSEEKQATSIIRTAVAIDAWNKEHNISGESICYEIVDSGTDAAYSEHNYGLFDNSMTRAKQGLNALRTFNKLVADKELTSYDDEVKTGWNKKGFLAEYTNASGKVYVAWDLNGSSNTSIKLSDLGNYADVKLYDYQGNMTPITSSSYTLSVGAEPQFVACENQAATITNVVVEDAVGKIKVYGKAYLADAVDVSICDESGAVLECKKAVIDSQGNLTAELGIYPNGEYMVYAGKEQLTNYGEYNLTINSTRPVLSGVVVASTGLNVDIKATISNTEGEKDVTVVVLPADVAPENAKFDDYVYIGQETIEGNEISLSFGVSEGSVGKYKLYMSALDAVKTSDIFIANMVEVSDFVITPNGQGNVVASAAVDSHGINVDKSVIIIAQYGEGERLLKADISEPGVEGMYKSFGAPRVDGAKTVKAFYWNGLDTVKPLSESVFMTE